MDGRGPLAANFHHAPAGATAARNPLNVRLTKQGYRLATPFRYLAMTNNQQTINPPMSRTKRLDANRSIQSI